MGHLFPVKNKDQFEERLDELKSKYPDATHHCYAWRINPVELEEFTQDDGEPGGTAGLPILNQLKSYDAINTGIIVVRYYGGTNLGKSGLIEAYGRSAELCLDQTNLKEIQLIQKVEISYPYSEQNTIEQWIHQFELKEIESEYLENVTLVLGCPQKKADAFLETVRKSSHLGIEANILKKDYL